MDINVEKDRTETLQRVAHIARVYDLRPLCQNEIIDLTCDTFLKLEKAVAAGKLMQEILLDLMDKEELKKRMNEKALKLELKL